MTADDFEELRELYQDLLALPPHARLDALADARARWRAEGAAEAARDALEAS